MIELNITEKEYRSLDDISYSLLSGISREGPTALVSKFEPNYATKFGVLTESLLFEDYNPNDYYIMKFYMPEGKLRDACDKIFPLHEPGELNVHKVANILLNNYIDYWDKKDNTWRANKIVNDKDVINYWKAYQESRGFIVISNSMYEKAQSAAQTLRIHQFTKDIFSRDSFFNVEKKSQVKLKFKYKGIDIKAMLDWLIIDHDNKIIRPYDLKTGGKSIEEFEQSFFYWRYDIQATLYMIGILKLRDELYPDYKVETFKFVYISRNDLDRPIIWKVKKKQYEASLKGFEKNGIKYKGILQLISDYKYYLESQNFEYSKEVYDASGELYINDNIIINNAIKN